jgi:hypothetical protein
MKTEDISVELRLADLEKVKAFADVTIPLGADGVIKLSGCSVIQIDGQAPRVVPPARKGKQKYFEVVSLIGKIRPLVDDAVLREYDRQVKAQKI